MKYFLSKYSHTSDDLLAEVDVSHIGPENLAGIFGQEVETFVESYRVGSKEAATLREIAGIELDLSEGEYFLEVFGQ
ncbi:MAG: hypothetical protein JO362_15110 [Streptomycetaceae bacterium]|nr:hypothetical protein [Streptomycetaceae bacterium]